MINESDISFSDLVKSEADNRAVSATFHFKNGKKLRVIGTTVETAEGCPFSKIKRRDGSWISIRKDAINYADMCFVKDLR